MSVLLSLSVLIASLLCWVSCVSLEGGITEVELMNSKLWKEENFKLFTVKKGSESIPSEYLKLIGAQFREVPVVSIIEVVCQGTSEDGELCSLLSQHQAVIKRGGGERGVVGADFPFQEYKDKMEFVSHVLEVIVGERLFKIDSHSSLVDFTAVNSEYLLVLVQNTSCKEYISLLKSYLLHQPPVPLCVTSSKTSLPLLQRPRYKRKEPPMYLWSVRASGKQWYMCQSLESLDAFILRSRYPVIVNYDDNKEITQQFHDKGMNLAFFFPALPGVSKLSFKKLVEGVASKICTSFIFIIGDREKHQNKARSLFVTDKKPRPQVAVLPNGMKKNLVTFGIETDDLQSEIQATVQSLLSFVKDDYLMEDGGSHEGDSQIPTLSSTDLQGIDLLVNNEEIDIIISFCKEGSFRCPDDAYYALESAQKVVKSLDLKFSFYFYIVPCKSVDEILKYKLNHLPSYVFYNGTQKTWTPGIGNPSNYRDILSLIAEVTGVSELLEQPLNSDPTATDDMIDYGHTLPQSLSEDDIYGKMALTLPRPVVPEELILTSDNFDDRIKRFEKTAILFYLSWSVENKILLHHFLAAWERLDKSKNVTLSSVSCSSYTDICTRFGVIDLPSLLLFTPSTLETLSPLPSSLGVLDSVHFLRALGQEMEESRAEVAELTPASLPILLKHSLTTPLVLWCDDDTPSSELGMVFSDVACLETYAQDFSFAWMNRSEYDSVLASVLPSMDADNFPTVIALRLDKQVVYRIEHSPSQLQASALRQQLLTFLDGLKSGSISPFKNLPHMKWPPLQPPIPFPSKVDTDTLIDHTAHDDDDSEMMGSHYYPEEMDWDSLPPDDPLEVREYPMSEDKGHEEEEEGFAHYHNHHHKMDEL